MTGVCCQKYRFNLHKIFFCYILLLYSIICWFIAGPICPQNSKVAAMTYFPYPVPENMSDDCLYLNVWTPALDAAAKLPVMVWIYGGTFQMGKITKEWSLFSWSILPQLLLFVLLRELLLLLVCFLFCFVFWVFLMTAPLYCAHNYLGWQHSCSVTSFPWKCRRGYGFTFSRRQWS